MKYLIINGSPRRKTTYGVIKQVTSNLEGNFEEIHLIEKQIPICLGCMNCIMIGEDKCPHFDKIHPIVEKMKESDAIIIGSPVYALNVSSLLKNFIDHTSYIYHRPQFFTKKGLVVVTTAGAAHKKVAGYIDEMLRHWGVNNVYKIAMACGGKESLETSKIDKTAKQFKKDVESNKLHSPKFGDIVYFNVWKAMVYSDNSIEADKKFWNDTGLVNYDYAPEIKLNIIKKLFSKIMFKFFKLVV